MYLVCIIHRARVTRAQTRAVNTFGVSEKITVLMRCIVGVVVEDTLLGSRSPGRVSVLRSNIKIIGISI